MHTLLGLVISSLIPFTYSQQLRPSPIDQPHFDLSSFNNEQIGFLGNFDALSSYSYVGESNFTNQNQLRNNLYYVSSDDDHFSTLGEVNGSIEDIIPLDESSFILLGSFEEIGTKKASSPAIYNITNNEIISINQNNELDGTVNTAYYDSDFNLIYLGGDFTFNGSHSAAIYNISNSSLSSPLFEGFGSSSSVNSITKFNSNIIFSGQFSTLGLPQLLSNTYNASNISIQSDQLVSLKYANFTSSADTSSPESVACGSSEWSVSDVTAATLGIDLPFTVIPSKVRIYNSATTDSQVSLFRLITAPANGIMNLTYVDIETGELAICDAWCPLYNASSLQRSLSGSTNVTTSVAYYDTSLSWDLSYQEFGFVNSIDVNSLTLQALDSYGSNIALAGFQIYQSLFSTYADDTLNEPSCDSTADYSRSDTKGDWHSTGQYLSLDADITDGIPDVGVTFYPNITYAGEYSILLYTPGCESDDSCDYRGIVNVTVTDEDNNVIESTLIYQTNTEEKYDSIFYGHLNGSVSIDLSLYSTVLSGDSSKITVVADRISTTIFSIDEIVNKNGTIPINGLFEYSPSNFTNFDSRNITGSKLVGNTTINKLGSELSDDANVHISVFDDSLFVGGNFKSSYGNFLKIERSNVETIDGGLNGNITGLISVDTGIAVIGDFDDIEDDTEITYLSSSDNLEGLALYNDSWYSFGVSSKSFIDIFLNGDDYYVFDEDVWNVDKNDWFNSSKLLDFNASAAGKTGNHHLFVGSLKHSDIISNKATFADESNNLTNTSGTSILSGLLTSGVYVNESYSVFGGNFTTSSNSSQLIVISNNRSSGLNIDWNSNSIVTKVSAIRDRLFVGSTEGGQIKGSSFQNVLVYDLNNNTIIDAGSLSTTSGSLEITEFGLLNDTYLVTGGNFESADSTNCPGLCFFNLNDSSWESLIDGFSGSVNSFRFVNNTIVCGGDIKYNGNELKLFAYDFNSTDDSQPSHFSDLDLIVKKFILVDNSTDGRIIVSGDDFISAYDSSDWSRIDSGLDDAFISDIALLDTSSTLSDSSYFSSDQTLIASGSFNITGYGYSNIAYFNGSDWIPYLIATHENNVANVTSIFLNKDVSSFYQSGIIYNSTSSSTPSSSATASSTASSSNTPKTVVGKSGKMDRGFIVLVGLASAVGTVSLLGGLGALLLFKKNKHTYTPLEPRVNETEMLDTVPPENLLKHI